MNRLPPLGADRRRGARGVSLVELMVGVAVGLVVTAFATTMVTAQLKDQRQLTLQVQLQQDLRAVADLVARDLRRAGSWAEAAQQLPALGAQRNPHVETAGLVPGQPVSQVRYTYQALADEGHAGTGIKLEAGVVKLLLGRAWQPLNDPAVLRVTDLQLTLHTQDQPLNSYCPRPCPPEAADCPVLQRRWVSLRVSGEATSDPRIQRTLATTVQLPNDHLRGACP